MLDTDDDMLRLAYFTGVPSRETGTALTDGLGGGLTWIPDTAGRWMTFQFDVISCD